MSDTENRKQFPLPAAAFLITALLYIILYLLLGFISSSGINIYKGDNYYEYLSFISSFMRVLKGEESFWYSFSLFAGSPMAATYMYTCMSPFNLLYLIPGISMVTMSLIISILKAGAAAASFAYFAAKRSKASPTLMLCASLAWALSSYSIMCFTEYMYADILYIFPFFMEYVLRAAETHIVKTSGKTMTEDEYKIKKKNRFDLIILILIYGFMFLTGYHTAIASAVFSIFCFAAIKFNKGEGHIKDNIFLSLRFIFALATGLGLTAILLLPALFYEHSHPLGNPFSLDVFTISIPELFTALFQGSANGSTSAVPYIYCGLPLLFILPSYITDKSIPLREKLLTAMLFFVCLLFPAPFLTSPCIVFLMLSLILKGDVPLLKEKHYMLTTLICICFYSVMISFENITGMSTVSRNGLYINGLFLILWTVFFIFTKKDKFSTGHLKKASLFILSLEFLTNACFSVNTFAGHTLSSGQRISSIEEKQLQDEMTALKNALPAADNDMYRIRIDGADNINAASFYGFNTLSSKGFFPDDAQTTTLHSLGVPASYDTSADITATPFGDDLFRVKYSVSGAGTGNLSVSENEDPLPIAFLLPDSLINGTPRWDANPLSNQERLIKAVTEDKMSIYESVSANLADAYMLDATAEKEGDYTVIKKISSMISNPLICLYDEEKEGYITYLYLNNAVAGSASPLINASLSGPNIALTADMNLLLKGSDTPYVPVGVSLNEISGKKYSHVTLSLTADEHTFKDMSYLRADINACKKASTSIGANPLDVSVIDKTLIEGDINVPTDRTMLFTTIPYDNGWEAYCDDEQEPVLMAAGGFCTLSLPEGQHHIILSYTAPGYVPGMVSSFAALMVLLLTLLFRPDKKKIIAESDAESTKSNEYRSLKNEIDV